MRAHSDAAAHVASVARARARPRVRCHIPGSRSHPGAGSQHIPVFVSSRDVFSFRPGPVTTPLRHTAARRRRRRPPRHGGGWPAAPLPGDMRRGRRGRASGARRLGCLATPAGRAPTLVATASTFFPPTLVPTRVQRRSAALLCHSRAAWAGRCARRWLVVAPACLPLRPPARTPRHGRMHAAAAGRGETEAEPCDAPFPSSLAFLILPPGPQGRSPAAPARPRARRPCRAGIPRPPPLPARLPLCTFSRGVTKKQKALKSGGACRRDASYATCARPARISVAGRCFATWCPCRPPAAPRRPPDAAAPRGRPLPAGLRGAGAAAAAAAVGAPGGGRGSCACYPPFREQLEALALVRPAFYLPLPLDGCLSPSSPSHRSTPSPRAPAPPVQGERAAARPKRAAPGEQRSGRRVSRLASVASADDHLSPSPRSFSLLSLFAHPPLVRRR